MWICLRGICILAVYQGLLDLLDLLELLELLSSQGL